jgi:hypothetical protein
MNKADLKLDWCSHEAAKYAVEKWHYSHRMPKGKLAKVGVWEFGTFIGAVVFGVGANPSIARPFGLNSTSVCELVRVALNGHSSSVSRIVSIAIRMIGKSFPGTRLIVSYADESQGHIGTIYQAGGWVFCGSSSDTYIRMHGKVEHRRVLSHRYGTNSLEKLRGIDPRCDRIESGLKHKYLMPLDAEMKARIEPLRKPYPKRERSADSGTPGNQSGRGGAIPTRSLQTAGGEG